MEDNLPELQPAAQSYQLKPLEKVRVKAREWTDKGRFWLEGLRNKDSKSGREEIANLQVRDNLVAPRREVDQTPAEFVESFDTDALERNKELSGQALETQSGAHQRVEDLSYRQGETPPEVETSVRKLEQLSINELNNLLINGGPQKEEYLNKLRSEGWFSGHWLTSSAIILSDGTLIPVGEGHHEPTERKAWKERGELPNFNDNIDKLFLGSGGISI